MTEALVWGAVSASSLVIGAAMAFVRPWRRTAVGVVLAFGAGALISAVTFELAEEGIAIGGPLAVGLGFALGAFAYWYISGVIDRRFGGGGGPALALGAFLDGVPEQMVLGIGIAAGDGVSVALVVAIFVSNLPEAIGSASDMLGEGRGRELVMRLWVGVAAVCTVACVAGYAIADLASDELKGGINGFAAGALLVMLTDSMVPEARRKAGPRAGLVTALGFAVAASLSGLS